MEFRNLDILGRHERGDTFVIRFAIPPGGEHGASRELLASLAQGCEVSLNDDLVDEGGEGLASFRSSRTGLETRNAGHGWSGEWRPIDEAAFLARVVELAGANRGGHASTAGSLTGRRR